MVAMGTECIENTCDTEVTEGTVPDQLRLRPRWYRLSPFRRRLSPTRDSSGGAYFEDCGADLLLVGDDTTDDQLEPVVLPALLDSEGGLGRNGLTRRLLPTGEVALFADPANGHQTLADYATGISGASGAAEGEGHQVAMGTVSLEFTAGAFPVLVRPMLTVSGVRLGYWDKSAAVVGGGGGTVTVPVLPAVSWTWEGSAQVVGNDTVANVEVALTTALGGSVAAPAFTIPARGSASMEVRGGLVYNDDIDATFPIVDGGRLSLVWALTELTASA